MPKKNDEERRAEIRQQMQAKFLVDGLVVYGEEAIWWRDDGIISNHPEPLTAEQIEERKRRKADEASSPSINQNRAGEIAGEKVKGKEEGATDGKESTGAGSDR